MAIAHWQPNPLTLSAPSKNISSQLWRGVNREEKEHEIKLKDFS